MLEVFAIILVVHWFIEDKAYTQLALYAKINKEGQLELVNELEIELGSNPEEILNNIDSNNFSQQNIKSSDKLGSDDKYSDIVRDVNSACKI